MTFGEIRNEVLSWLDEGGSVGSTRTNIDNAINDAHRRRMTSELWPFLVWDTAETFTLTAGLQTYPLHQEFHRPLYFYNRTRKTYWKEVASRQLGPSGIKWNTDRDRQPFTLWGRTPVKVQPTAGPLSILSSSASDASVAKAVTIRGVEYSTGAVRSESITPNGVTQVPGGVTYTKILSVTLAAAWTGTFELRDAANDTILTLYPGEVSRSYQQLYLLGSPSSADVIEYRFYRLPRPLSQANDQTDLPPGHEQLLVWDTLLLLAAYDGRLDMPRMSEWKEWQKEAEIALRKATIEIQPLEAEPQFIRDTDNEGFDGPAVWLT